MMEVSRSTYYETTLREDLQLKKDLALRDKIETIQKEFPGYGYRRLYQHLLRSGEKVNSKRIRRVLKRFSLFPSTKPKFRPRGSRAGKKLVFPNLIRGLELTAPNQLWATDFTYVRLMCTFAAMILIGSSQRMSRPSEILGHIKVQAAQ